MADYAKGRLYALGISPADYLDLGGFMDSMPKDNAPYFVNQDQRGLDVICDFTSEEYRSSWAARGKLVIPTRRILATNNSSATTSRTWVDWLRYYVRSPIAEKGRFYLYMQSWGMGADLTEYLRNSYYRIKILQLPEWLNGSLNNYTEARPKLELEYSIDDEGSFDKIETAPLATNDYSITGVNTGTKKFTVAGDQTAYFKVARVFEVTGSTGNDGSYYCTTNSVLNGSSTEITVAALPDTTVDGQIELPNIVSRGARSA